MELSQLNDMQQKAVLHTQGPLLLLAGAGSGKTRVLTYRIAHLVEEGVKPWNILAITFTNKAAKEMRERVNKLVENNAESIWVSTFHSMCVRILRRDIEKIGYEKSFSIYDTDDQERLIKECLANLNLDIKLFPPKGVLATISSLKNELISYTQFENNPTNNFRDAKIAKIYTLYQQKLMSNNSLDFDDIIFKTIDLFKQAPDVLNFYQQKFEYIMVDEYQDTNTAQYQLIKFLADKFQNLCVVGDDDQSIYGWRGANIRNILDFEKDFKNAATIKLEQNYRSTKTILDAANAVISNNKSRKPKSLWTENNKGDFIHIINIKDHFEEGVFVTDEIKKLVSENKSYSDFAILYRTNAQSRTLEEKLVQANIPYRLFGGTRFYDRKEIKDIICYLKILNNPFDDLAIKRIINVPKRGIGDSTINKIGEFAILNNLSFFDTLNMVDSLDLGRTTKKLKDFIEFVDLLSSKALELQVDELIDFILDKTDYIKQLQLENTPESLGRIANLEELISKAAEYKNSTDEPSLAGFLEEVALVADIDNYQQSSNTVILMTLHSAKGLEFPYVFITGMEEGLFPSYRSMTSQNPNDLEEERRLCYVGITRAKEQLYLLSAKSRMINGTVQYNEQSRFLKEIPLDLAKSNLKSVPDKMVKYQNTPKSSKLGFKNLEKTEKIHYSYTLNAPKNIHIDYKQGDRVKHKKFGSGTVKEIKPAGADYEVLVDFDSGGNKRLMSNFAKLEKL